MSYFSLPSSSWMELSSKETEGSEWLLGEEPGSGLPRNTAGHGSIPEGIIFWQPPFPIQAPSPRPKVPKGWSPGLAPMHVMSGEAGKGRATVPSYSPHTLHRQSPASPALLHTVCSSSPRPQPRSSSCSPDGPPGAWKQSQGYTDRPYRTRTTSFSLIIWLMVLTFFES